MKETTEDPEEVKDFLFGSKKTVKLGKPIKIGDLTKEEKEILKQTPDDSTDIPQVDTPRRTDFENNKAIDTMISFAQTIADLGKIEVSDYEKDLYMKALLNDYHFELELEPFNGFNIKVRNRTLAEEEFVYQCLAADTASEVITGPEAYFTRLQHYLATFQVSSIGGKDCKFAYTSLKPFDTVYKRASKHIEKVFNPMHTLKWNALVLSVRVFDAKEKICNDNLRNNSFWSSAGTN